MMEQMFFENEDLLTLITVYEEGSFRSAAEKLNKSPSTITYSIKKIEDKLKIKLFDRDSYRAKARPECEFIYLKALEIIEKNLNLVNYGEVLSSGVEANINMMICPYSDLSITAKIYKEFKKKFRNTNLRVKLDKYPMTKEKFYSEQLNICLTNLDLDEAEFEIKQFKVINLIPVATPEHFAHNKGMDINEIEESTEIKLRGEKLTQWQVLSLDAQKQLVSSGVGWAYLPKTLIQEELKKGTLKEIECLAAKDFNLTLTKRKSADEGPACKYLWDLYSKHIESSIK